MNSSLLKCLPILISLETSESEQVAGRALELHAKLHAKHSTLVNVRFVECAKSSYEYQRSITSEVSGLLRYILSTLTPEKICETG